MKVQLFVLILFFSSASVIALIAYYVFRSSQPKAINKESVKDPIKKRGIFLFIWFFILAVIFSITLPKSPYYIFADETPNQVVYVAARQFFFMLANEPIEPNVPKMEKIEVPVNKTVEFRVTSFDVNHGFAIYNERSELVIQTQAMPGYINKLRWKFKEPGNYKIFCLEYCGAGHQLMQSSFVVK